MSLINQVLKDIEQRQVSLQLEDSNLKTKLHPAIGVMRDDWHLPDWLKPFFIMGVIVALVYFFRPNLPDFSFSRPVSEVVKNQDANNQPEQVHYLLTKTLSSDWQTLVGEKGALDKRSDKQIQKKLDLARESVLNINEQITSNKDGVAEAVTANHDTEAKKSVLGGALTAAPQNTTKQDGALAANLNFTSSVTPAVGVEAVQVFKQMKPEQEANQHLQRAMDMHQRGNIADAIDATRKALQLAPQSEDARQLLAAYLVESKQPQEAAVVLQTGLQLQPKLLGLRKALAKLQLAEGQQEKALETLQQGADQATRDADYSAFWAITLQKSNKHNAALPLFEQALRVNPSQVQWMVAYAVSLQAEGRTQEALKQFQEAQNLPATERLSIFIQQRIQQLQNP